MGETGCGKTTLVRFMCALSAGSQSEDEQPRAQKNMVLVKVKSVFNKPLLCDVLYVMRL